jgi:hypothetical protein
MINRTPAMSWTVAASFFMASLQKGHLMAHLFASYYRTVAHLIGGIQWLFMVLRGENIVPIRNGSKGQDVGFGNGGSGSCGRATAALMEGRTGQTARDQPLG